MTWEENWGSHFPTLRFIEPANDGRCSADSAFNSLPPHWLSLKFSRAYRGLIAASRRLAA